MVQVLCKKLLQKYVTIVSPKYSPWSYNSVSILQVSLNLFTTAVPLFDSLILTSCRTSSAWESGSPEGYWIDGGNDIAIVPQYNADQINVNGKAHSTVTIVTTGERWSEFDNTK